MNFFGYRYGILTKETKATWRGDEKAGVEFIMSRMNIPRDQFQLGLTKVFVKAPETVRKLN